MAQPVLLRLSPAEWMLCVMVVQPDADAALAQSVNRTMSPERLQGSLQTARDVLLARDLAHLMPNGKLDINPVVRLCARAVLTPRASFGLTVIEPDGSSSVTFYNWLPGFTIGTWVDENQIRSFELLDSSDLIGLQVLTRYLGNEPMAGGESAEVRSFTVQAATLPTLPVDKPEKVNGLATALARGGLSGDDATALEHAFASPTRRAVLAAASSINPRTRTLLWLMADGKVWLIAQDTGAATVSVSSANMAGLNMTLNTYVHDVLATVNNT